MRYFVLLVLALSLEAAGQAYPSRSITMVVPFTPGGGTDLMGRLFSERLSRGLGSPVIVDNRPGAGGAIGTEYVASAAPDGHTLLMGSVSTISINPSLHKGMKSNPMKDLAPVSLVASTPSIVAVPVGLPVNTMPELIAFARQKPGALNFGSAGAGTSHHLAGELLKLRAGVDMVHVPYKGTSPALTGLIRGDVQVLIANIPSLAPALQAKSIKPLAITSAKRSHQMPELRTVAESGLSGFEVTVWYGIFAPTGTPEPVIARLNEEIRKITQLPEVQQHMLKEGADAVSSSPKDLRDLMERDFEKWADVVQRAGVSTN